MNFGRKYGLIGQNGSGKSTILAAIAAKEVPVPDIIDMWFLDCEAPPSDADALTSVTQKAKDEVKRYTVLFACPVKDFENKGFVLKKLMEEDAEKNAQACSGVAHSSARTTPSSASAPVAFIR